MDPYTVAMWRARLLARHHQAILQTLVVLAVLVLVLLFAGAAGAAQTALPAQPAKPAMGGQMKMGELKMGEMKQACEARHEASAKDVEALAKTVTAATASNDPAVLRAALEATLRHLEGMQAKAATCAGMMGMMKAGAAAAEPPREAPAAKPEDPAHKH